MVIYYGLKPRDVSNANQSHLETHTHTHKYQMANQWTHREAKKKVTFLQ